MLRMKRRYIRTIVLLQTSKLDVIRNATVLFLHVDDARDEAGKQTVDNKPESWIILLDQSVSLTSIAVESCHFLVVLS